MKFLRVVFRVDSNQKMGTGHLLECLRLAKITKMRAIFCICEDKKSVELIKQFNFPVEVIKTRKQEPINEFEILNKLIKKTKPNLVVVDMLRFNEVDRRKIILEGARLAIFNAIFYPVRGDVNFTTVFLPLLKNRQYSGTKYILLRPSLIGQKSKIIKRPVKKIIIMFGGSDPENLTLKTLGALALIQGKIGVDIVIGGGNMNKEIIERFVQTFRKPYKIYVNVRSEKNLFKLMMGADLAIASGGYTLCELMSLGIPTIAMAQNMTEEKKIYPLFPKNAIENIGRGKRICIPKLSTSIIGLMHNYSKRKIMNIRSPKVIDGKGIFRVYDILKKVVDQKYEQ